MTTGPVVTVNPVNPSKVAIAVVIVRVRVDCDASESIVIVIGTLVAVPPLSIVAVTPVPLKRTSSALFKFVPVTVADIVEPTKPNDGLMAVISIMLDAAKGIFATKASLGPCLNVWKARGVTRKLNEAVNPTM